jgi:hypothetical protein
MTEWLVPTLAAFALTDVLLVVGLLLFARSARLRPPGEEAEPRHGRLGMVVGLIAAAALVYLGVWLCVRPFVE